MNDSSLKMCIDCANKQFDPKLPKGMFYGSSDISSDRLKKIL